LLLLSLGYLFRYPHHKRAEIREHRTKSRGQRAESKEQRAESREQRAMSKRQRAKSREQKAKRELIVIRKLSFFFRLES